MPRAFKTPPYLEIRRFDAPVAHRKAGGCHDGSAATELVDIATSEAALT